MLDCPVVEIRQKGFTPPLTWTAPAGVKPSPTKAETKPESLSPALAQETVSLTAPAGLILTPEVPANLTAPAVPTAATTKPVHSFSNGPLTLDLDGSASVRFTSPSSVGAVEPVYLEEIRVLESRYPGVADKLKAMELKAVQSGYSEVGSKKVESALLESPPWPTTTFGDPRENITAKAKELHQTHPQTKSQDASTYDFKKAAGDSDRLLETLDGLFEDGLSDLAISTRAKAPKSLSNKMDKMIGYDPNFTLGHLTDTVGARIDAPDLKSMGEVAKRLEKLYDGKIIAKSDYVSQPGDNGYRAIHYIIDIGGRMAEIQTSTHSLRTADLATHDTVYKAEFPVSPETSKELSTAADRIMFLECLKAQGSG